MWTKGFISQDLFQVFPRLAIHICGPCAWRPRWRTCWPEAWNGDLWNYLRSSWDEAKTVWCWWGGIRHRGEEGEDKQPEKIYLCSLSLSVNKAMRGSSSCAPRQEYLCWKETQKPLSYSARIFHVAEHKICLCVKRCVVTKKNSRGVVALNPLK